MKKNENKKKTTKHSQVPEQKIKQAMTEQTTMESAMDWLRSQGYKFANQRMRPLLRKHKPSTIVAGKRLQLVLDNPILSEELKDALRASTRPYTFTFDIESTPLIAMVWGAFKQFLSPSQIVQYNKLLSIQFKLITDDTIYNLTRQDYSHEELVKLTHDLLTITDVVIAQNGVQFDVKMMNMFFIEMGLTPPSEYKVADTMLIAKSVTRFPHKSLAGMGKQLSLKSQKQDNSGFSLWTRCMSGYDLVGSFWQLLGIDGKPDPEAWDEMIEYGVYDILATEELYLRLRPWHKTHPNHNLYNDSHTPVCPKCGSIHIKYDGVARTGVNRVYALVCSTCGGRSKERYTALSKEKRQSVIANS